MSWGSTQDNKRRSTQPDAQLCVATALSTFEMLHSIDARPDADRQRCARKTASLVKRFSSVLGVMVKRHATIAPQLESAYSYWSRIFHFPPTFIEHVTAMAASSSADTVESVAGAGAASAVPKELSDTVMSLDLRACLGTPSGDCCSMVAWGSLFEGTASALSWYVQSLALCHVHRPVRTAAARARS